MATPTSERLAKQEAKSYENVGRSIEIYDKGKK
jgi:hypothetical protein